jgi:hypothetical protein
MLVAANLSCLDSSLCSELASITTRQSF